MFSLNTLVLNKALNQKAVSLEVRESVIEHPPQTPDLVIKHLGSLRKLKAEASLQIECVSNDSAIESLRECWGTV